MYAHHWLLSCSNLLPAIQHRRLLRTVSAPFQDLQNFPLIFLKVVKAFLQETTTSRATTAGRTGNSARCSNVITWDVARPMHASLFLELYRPHISSHNLQHAPAIIKTCMCIPLTENRGSAHIFLSLADDHDAVHLHRRQHFAHHVHCRLVRCILVPLISCNSACHHHCILEHVFITESRLVPMIAF